MSIAHHPGDELLLSYASGAASEGVALIVATHTTFCAQCRASVQRAEAAGGSVLADMAPVSMSAKAYESVLSRLDAPAREVVKAAHLQSNVPVPLQPYVGTDFDTLPWRRVAGGISHLPIKTKGGMKVRLIRAEPGSGVYKHTHKGEEWTLVLTGSYTDKTGHYAVGDMQSTTPEIVHRPTADAGPVCINLAVTDAPLVFRGLMPKLVAKFHGF
jgi:putative transcriptional regulator